MSFSFTLLGSILVVLMIVDFFKGRLAWDKVQVGVTVICIVASGLGVLLYGIGWLFATTITETGLHGPTLWGFRTTINWNDIASVQRVSDKGIPYLIIRSRTSKKVLSFCVLGLNDSEILERLQAFIPAGDSHETKQGFDQNESV